MGYRSAIAAAADLWAAQANQKFVPPDYIFWMYASAGQHQKALEWLEVGYSTHDSNMPYPAVNSILRSLHEEPDFLDLLERLNLPMPSEGRMLNQ